MGFLKPKAPKSDNQNNEIIKSTYGGQMQQGTGANNFLSALLTGIGDVGGANAGYEGYMDRFGFQPALKKLQKGVVGGNAARGLLRSGSTQTRLLEEGTALNQQYGNNYLQQLAGLSGLGLQAGNLVTSAGSRSQGGSPSTAGTIAGIVGSVLPFIPSDPRLKEDVEKVGEFEDGLGIYLYRYLNGARKFVGVMADEVANLRPWALGPKIHGYATVNYGAL